MVQGFWSLFTPNTTAGITGGLSGVRTRSRSAAGAWGAVSAVTSRPPVDPFSPGAVPNFTTPTLAADPASGALIATFPGSTDYLMLDALGNGDDWTPDYSSNRAWVALGSVTGGLGAPSEHGGGRIGLIEAAGAPGRFALAGYLGRPGDPDQQQHARPRAPDRTHRHRRSGDLGRAPAAL